MRPYVDEEWGWNDAWQREYFDRKFDHAAYLIIRVSDSDTGVVVIERDEETIYLGLIEVAPPFQSKGIGSEILRGLQSEAQETGRTVSLHVLRSNQRATDLYHRHGFRTMDEEAHRVKMQWKLPAIQPDRRQAPRPPITSGPRRRPWPSYSLAAVTGRAIAA